MRGGGYDSEKAAAPAGGPSDFGQAHQELLADRSIQFDLQPMVRAAPPPQQPAQSSSGGEPITFTAGGAADIGPVIQFVFWALIAIAALALLYFIVSRVAGWQRQPRRDRAEAQPEWQIAAEPARQLLGDADELAAQGLYSEAAHLLLHRSIGEIEQRRPRAVRKALTSRDIAGLPSLPPSPAVAFGRIVRAVERSLFAGRTLDASDWRQCREAYERFAFAREWQS